MAPPGDDPFVEHSLRTSMYFPQTRLFVAGNPKAAGTTLRWWLLPLHGVDLTTATADSLWGESAPFQVVWDGRLDLRYSWRWLSEAERSEALSASDVLNVLPVRHPVSRAFSAWAGKYLTLEPRYHDQLPAGFDPPPDQVESADHVSALFTRFVAALHDAVESGPGWSALNVHFWPQHRLLGREPVGPTLELRQEAMAQGLASVTDHLRSHGIDAPPAPRLNESVVPYHPELVSDEALAGLAALYAADFERWQYPADRPSGGHQQLDLPWLNDVRGRNRRYAVVHAAALTARRQLRVAEQALVARDAELSQARRRARRATQRVREVTQSRSWRLTRPLRWLSPRRGRAKPAA